MREPNDGDVLLVPLPDGTFGLAQVLTNRLVAFFARRTSEPPSIDDVRGAPLAFRAFVTPEYWRDERWKKLGRTHVDASIISPIRLWDCRPDHTGFYDEWRYRQPSVSLGEVGPSQVENAIPASIYACTAELWLFRHLEGIPYDPWWLTEHLENIRLPWASPVPPGFDYTWDRKPQPDTIDAPARDKLLAASLEVGHDDAPSPDDAVVTWHASASKFVEDLAYVPSREWVETIEAPLAHATQTSEPMTVDECGEALGAAFVLAVAGGAKIDVRGVSKLVLRIAPKALKPATRAKLAPVAAAALAAILHPEHEMASLLSEAPDYETFVAKVKALIDWFGSTPTRMKK